MAEIGGYLPPPDEQQHQGRQGGAENNGVHHTVLHRHGQRRQEPGDQVPQQQIVDGVEQNAPEHGIFHRHIAQHQPHRKGKGGLDEIPVVNSKQKRRSQNGKFLAIGLEAPQNQPAEQNFLRNRGQNTRIQEHTQAVCADFQSPAHVQAEQLQQPLNAQGQGLAAQEHHQQAQKRPGSHGAAAAPELLQAVAGLFPGQQNHGAHGNGQNIAPAVGHDPFHKVFQKIRILKMGNGIAHGIHNRNQHHRSIHDPIVDDQRQGRLVKFLPQIAAKCLFCHSDFSSIS